MKIHNIHFIAHLHNSLRTLIYYSILNIYYNNFNSDNIQRFQVIYDNYIIYV